MKYSPEMPANMMEPSPATPNRTKLVFFSEEKLVANMASNTTASASMTRPIIIWTIKTDIPPESMKLIMEPIIAPNMMFPDEPASCGKVAKRLSHMPTKN